MAASFATSIARLAAGAALACPAACVAVPRQEASPAAAAMIGCTQEDLPATIVTVARGRASEGTLRIEIAGAPQRADAPRRLALSPLRRAPGTNAADLARATLEIAGRPPVWLEGTVTIRRLLSGERVAGDYALRTPAGAALAGSFDAAWQPSRADCG
ncbi:MAG: hypothetical protein WDN44_14285 [Sphingomonas sp.]